MNKKSAIPLVISVTLLVLFSVWAHYQDKQDKANHAKANHAKVLYNAFRLAQEWAYFEGQKEAIAGDVRIRYNEATKNYSWTKSCWDDGSKPIFDPFKSEDMNHFATKENLLK